MKLLRRVTVRPKQMPDGKSTQAPVALQEGEHVLFIGSINNMNGTVAISTWDGTVLWPINLSDLEEI